MWPPSPAGLPQRLNPSRSRDRTQHSRATGLHSPSGIWIGVVRRSPPCRDGSAGRAASAFVVPRRDRPVAPASERPSPRVNRPPASGAGRVLARTRQLHPRCADAEPAWAACRAGDEANLDSTRLVHYVRAALMRPQPARHRSGTSSDGSAVLRSGPLGVWSSFAALLAAAAALILLAFVGVAQAAPKAEAESKDRKAKQGQGRRDDGRAGHEADGATKKIEESKAKESSHARSNQSGRQEDRSDGSNDKRSGGESRKHLVLTRPRARVGPGRRRTTTTRTGMRATPTGAPAGSKTAPPSAR